MKKETVTLFQLMVIVVIAALVGADQLSKWWVHTYFQVEHNESPLTVIDGVVSFVYHANEDGAFGMFPGMRWVLIVLTALMLLFITIVLLSGRFRRYPIAMIGGLLVVGGGIGNLIDRLFRQNGGVVDFIRTDFIRFPTFNVADCFVVIGAVLLFVFFVFFYTEENSKHGKQSVIEKEAVTSGDETSSGSTDSIEGET